MNFNAKFLITIIIFYILLLISLWFVHSFESQKNTIDLSLIATLLFTIQSIILFFVLHVSVKNKNRQIFISVTLINMIVKMILSIGVLLYYREILNPTDGKFLIPFLVVYTFFTVFETSIMIKIAGRKP